MKKPSVAGGVLSNPTEFGDERWLIERNPEAWKLFIQRNKAFTFIGSGQFKVSIRKERRGGGEFWYAYKRSNKKLFNAYVGSDDQVTLARLSEVTSELRGKIKRFEVQDSPKVTPPIRPFTPQEIQELENFRVTEPPLFLSILSK